MKIFSWNIRGLGRCEKKRVVRRVCSKEKLNLVFIQESKLQEVNSRTLRLLSGKGSFQGEWVGSIGAAGGLISLWDEIFFNVEGKIVNQRFILLEGVVLQRNFKCGFGNIYAPNDEREKQTFWEELGAVLRSKDFPWCLGGDFNTVRYAEEKIGAGYNHTAMSQFSNFIDDCGLLDLPMSGGKFT